jgi:hypothetical protein
LGLLTLPPVFGVNVLMTGLPIKVMPYLEFLITPFSVGELFG